MSEETTTPEENVSALQSQPDTKPTPKEDDTQPESIFLVSYPKIVFLYPTFLAALFMGIYTAIAKDPATADGAWHHSLSLSFLVILGVNLVVLSFDFPRGTSLTLFFFFVAVGIGLYSLFNLNENLLPFVTEMMKAIKPFANATFYFSLAGILGLIFVGVAVTVRFDYWEVRPNELLHHHGVLSDLGRYSAPSLRIDKEINDVFEFILLGSGRLILHPSNERRAIVLENVFFINRKEEEITRMLGALQVQVRTDG
jgi:hypothetical protein